MSKVVELRGKLDERRQRLASIFEEAGEDYDMSKVTSLDGDSAAKAQQIKALNDEMTDLSKEIEDLDGMAAIDQQNQGRSEPIRPALPVGGKGAARAEEQPETLGSLFVDSVALKGWRPGMTEGPAADFSAEKLQATLFQTSAGWSAPSIRGPQLVDLATRPIQVVDLFPQGQTSQASIIYMEETTFTNAAVEIAEGASKPEATLALTERTEPVRKIAVWLPVTDEQLADVPQVRSYIDNRLGFMVRQRLDSQLLVGDGIAPNLKGLLNRSGIQTQAKGADDTPTAVYKAMQLIRVNAFSEPNAAVFHPNDWTDIRTLKTADGIFIWGAPYDSGPDRIWGLRVVQATGLTQNTGLVGDFQQAQLFWRENVSMKVGYVNDDLIKNRQTIVAELRLAEAVYRPAAFATVTGI